MRNLLWFGGSYRQDYGLSGFVGVTLNKKFLIGYSYGFGSESLPGIGASTHEINLRISLGQRNQRSNNNPDFFVSYVDTERVYADQRVKKQKSSEEIAKANEPTPIIVEIVEPIVEETVEEPEVPSNAVRTSEHDDPRLVMTRGRSVTTIRSETVYVGTSDFELPKGNYIIVGEYADEVDAKQYHSRLENEGYRAEYGYVSSKWHWMVYIYRSE